MPELNKLDICPIEEGRTQYIPFRKIDFLNLKKSEDDEEDPEPEEEDETGKLTSYNDSIKCNTREEGRFFEHLETLISKKDEPDWVAKRETCISSTIVVSPLRNIFVAVNELCDLFCFDLDNNKYWWLMKCTDYVSVYFHPHSESLIFIGRKNGRIDELSIETKTIYGFFKEHIYGVRSMSFNNNNMCLSHSNYEAWIWDINTFEPLFSLALKDNLPTAIVTFIPNVKNYFITLFPDNTFYVWSERQGYFPVLKEIYSGSEFNLSRTTEILEFPPWNDQLMALGGNHNQIHLINISKPLKWSLEKMFILPEKQKYTKAMKFLKIRDNNNNQEEKKCLAVFASPFREITIYDLDKNEEEAIVEIIDIEEVPVEFDITFDGKFALFQTYQQVLMIYTTFWWLNRKFYPWLHFNRLAHIFMFNKNDSKNYSSNLGSKEIISSCSENKFPEEESGICSEQKIIDIKKILTPKYRFKRILLAYGKVENVNRHRLWIWAFELPFNMKAFNKLYSEGLHPYCTELFLRFRPLPTKYVVKCIRLISIFYWWSSIFILIKDFEKIVLHFCKFFSWSTLSAFECIVTIIENYCSQWFGCWSKTPQEINNVINKIMKSEIELCAHLKEYNMEVSYVGWILLRSFFINVLIMSDWMVLWDHIIAGDDKFMVMVAVSIIYNCRTCFLSLTTRKDLEDFEKYLKNYTKERSLLPSILALAYDLHFNQMKDDWPFKKIKFTPISKALSYPNINIEYDEHLLREEVLYMEKRREIEFIHLQERLDCLTLLDPRIYHSIKKEKNIKTFLIENEKNKAQAEYNGWQNNLMTIYNELIENKIKEKDELKKHKHIQIKRIVVLECLLHILKKHELVWLKCFSLRCEERKRLISFEETVKIQENENIKKAKVCLEEIPLKSRILIKGPPSPELSTVEDFHIKSLDGRSLVSVNRQSFLKLGNLDNKKIFKDLGFSIENDLKKIIKEYNLIEQLNKHQPWEDQETYMQDLSGRLLITFDFNNFIELQKLPVFEKIVNDFELRIEDHLQNVLANLRKLKCQMVADLNEVSSSSSESEQWPALKRKSAKEIEDLFFSPSGRTLSTKALLKPTHENTVEDKKNKMYHRIPSMKTMIKRSKLEQSSEAKKKIKIPTISSHSREIEMKNEAEELTGTDEQNPPSKLDEPLVSKENLLPIKSFLDNVEEEKRSKYSDSSEESEIVLQYSEHYSKEGSSSPLDVISTVKEKLSSRRKKQIKFIKSLDIELNKGQIKMLLEFLEKEIPDLGKLNSEL